MTTRRKFMTITVGLGVAAFLLGPHLPLGSLIWPEPVPPTTQPTGPQTVLFALLFAVTGLSFGAGTALAVLGWPTVRDMFGPDRRRLAMATHVSVVWVLWNWWLHDGLHMVVRSTGGVLAIEYAFHVTLMIAGAVVAYGAIVLAGMHQRVRARSELSRRAATAAP